MSLDPSTLVWMIINFLLLMILLNHFLFKPMLSFMKQRQDKIDAGLQAGEQARQLLADKETELALALTQAKSQAGEQINDAVRQLSADKTEKEGENAAYADTRLTEIAGVLFAEEERLAASAEQHIPEYVSILQDKLTAVGPARGISVTDEKAREAILNMLSDGGETA